MKKIFTKLLFLVMLISTPLLFTSCGNLLSGIVDEIIDEMDKIEDEMGGEYDEDDTVDVPSYDKVESEIIEFDAYGVSGFNLLAGCINLTHEYKYSIEGLGGCEWARVEWVRDYDGNKWTPLLTVDENNTGEPRVVDITIALGENNICHHILYQYPY